LVALAPGCAETSANTGRTTSVLFVPVGEGGSRSEVAIRERLGSRGDLELRSLERLASLAAADVSRDEGDRDEQAQDRLARADEAFSRFDYQAATTLLAEALEILRPTASSASGRRRLASVHLSLANVLLVHGERGAALEEVRTCMHLDERCAPDPADHPPELVALHRELADAAPAEPATLRVTTDPPGARARIDGDEGAETPREITGIRPGRHYLSLDRDGFREEIHVLSLAAGETTERTFALTAGSPEHRAAAAMRALSSQGVHAEPRWRAQAAGLAGADLLLVLGLHGGRLTLGAFDARGAAIADALEQPSDDPDAATAWLEHVMPTPSVPWFGQWWFWTPVVVGIALGFGAVVFAAARTPPVRLVGGSIVGD
jgi:hypothetical protein